MYRQDTIAAIATPAGRGGVGIVRVTGNNAYAIAQKITGCELKPRYAHFTRFGDRDHNKIDEGIALYFPSPGSYTGEDVVEFHGHGSPVVLDQLLKTVISSGARLAQPGEFTQRAFLNDKMDLSQAEAVADVIDATSVQAARSAMASLQGAFSKEVSRLTQQLTNLRIYIEAAIDFPDEEVDFLTEGQVAGRLADLFEQISVVESQATKGRALQEGLTLVLAGLPNAGKSSLLNLLADDDRAIVTETPGTTRDMVREQIHIDGMPLNIIDTAGLRESNDTIEQEGVKRAQKAITEAHRVLLVVDDSQTPSHRLTDCLPKALDHDSLADTPVTMVRNKIDLTGNEPALRQNEDTTVVTVSAKSGAGAQLLRHHLRDCAGLGDSAEGAFTARRRHLNALEQAKRAIDRAQTQLTEFHAGELVAEELRSAQTALTEVTGDYTTEDLLGDIFSSFCIGK